MNAYNWKKISAYCLGAAVAAAAAATRSYHPQMSMIAPAVVGCVTMFVGLVVDATKRASLGNVKQ